MKKRIIILILAILVVALIFSARPLLTGRIIDNNQYSYTTAICDENNYCEDYFIECEGETTTKFIATGFSIQHKENWTDNRNDTGKHCNRTD